MWRTIAVSALRCGAVYCAFGVFGIGFILYKRIHPIMVRRNQPPTDDTETR